MNLLFCADVSSGKLPAASRPTTVKLKVSLVATCKMTGRQSDDYECNPALAELSIRTTAVAKGRKAK